MNRVRLFLAGEKGHVTLCALIAKYRFMIVDVVGSSYPGVDCDFYEEIRQLCVTNNICHRDRKSLEESESDFHGYVLAVGWRWMLPPAERLVVIHDSLLPKYRGFAPLVNCLINGEKEIGATAFFANGQYDEGPIISQGSRRISYPISIAEAIRLMCSIYVDLAEQLFVMIDAGASIETVAQDEEGATYSLWRDEEDYWIDWTSDAARIARFVDAVGPPYAGARCVVDGSTAVVRSACVVTDLRIADRQAAIGKVLSIRDGAPIVVCAIGLLKINELTTEEGKTLLPLQRFRSRFCGPK